MKNKEKNNIKRFINNINKKLILGSNLKPSGSISATDIPIIATERACICSKKPSLVRTGNPHFHDREFFDSREANINPSHFANPASETILLAFIINCPISFQRLIRSFRLLFVILN